MLAPRGFSRGVLPGKSKQDPSQTRRHEVPEQDRILERGFDPADRYR